SLRPHTGRLDSRTQRSYEQARHDTAHAHGGSWTTRRLRYSRGQHATTRSVGYFRRDAQGNLRLSPRLHEGKGTCTSVLCYHGQSALSQSLVTRWRRRKRPRQSRSVVARERSFAPTSECRAFSP